MWSYFDLKCLQESSQPPEESVLKNQFEFESNTLTKWIEKSGKNWSKIEFESKPKLFQKQPQVFLLCAQKSLMHVETNKTNHHNGHRTGASNLKRVTEVTSKSYESNPLGRNGSNRIGRGKGYYRTDAGGIGRNRKIGY